MINLWLEYTNGDVEFLTVKTARFDKMNEQLRYIDTDNNVNTLKCRAIKVKPLECNWIWVDGVVDNQNVTNDYMTDGEIDGIKLAKLGTKNKWR